MKRFSQKIITTLAILISMLTIPVAQASICVLDITARTSDNEINGSNSRQLYSAKYLCDIAGYDYYVATDIEEATKADVVLISGIIHSNTFTREEYEKILDWVKKGGRLISPAIIETDSNSGDLLSEIFGIDASAKVSKSSTRTIINWNPDFFEDKELEYIDEAEERETSVGSINTYSVAAKDCDVLAHYANGDPAVVRNSVGDGKTYLIPLSWRNVVQRNQLNKDQSASRQYNNGFEPSSDIWAFLLRSIHADATPLSVWKFTVPDGYTQLLVPTHDCDSRTAYDEMHYMSEYEKSLGLKGHYFLTTHYYSDKINFGHSYLSDFYNSTTIPKAAALLEDGHTVGSHSVCHFPDFNKVANTDTVTREEYAFRATCEDGVSRGASTWAEIVMSKQILEEDLANNVRSFRSGHLCVNKDFHKMLKEGEYTFQSCYTGGDLLSEFPFFGRYNNDWSGELAETLTIQLHISDVYNNKDGEPLNNDTWETHRAPDEWEAAMKKLRGNYASAVLLIHPNREWKMILQKRLTERLDPEEVGLYNFEDYGDFWLSRLNCSYDYEFDKDAHQLTIVTDLDELKRNKLAFALEDSENAVESVVFTDKERTEQYPAVVKRLTQTRLLASPVSDKDPQSTDQVFSVPDSSYSIFDIHGRLVAKNNVQQSALPDDLPKGIYIVSGAGATKKIMH